MVGIPHLLESGMGMRCEKGSILPMGSVGKLYALLQHEQMRVCGAGGSLLAIVHVGLTNQEHGYARGMVYNSKWLYADLKNRTAAFALLFVPKDNIGGIRIS